MDKEVRDLGITISERGVVITVTGENGKILESHFFPKDLKPLPEKITKITEEGIFLESGKKYDGAVGHVDLIEMKGWLKVELGGKVRTYRFDEKGLAVLLFLFGHEDKIKEVLETVVNLIDQYGHIPYSEEISGSDK